MNKRKKVLLITPPYHCGVLESAGRWPNLGFIYLAGALREAGYEPIIYDAMSKFHNFTDIANRIEEEAPYLVATTSYTATFSAGLEVLRLAKEINSRIVTVIGGIHPTFMWKEALNSGVVDFVVRGEGEETLVELLRCLDEKTSPSKVRGIAYLEGGKAKANPLRPFISDLDFLTPAWDLVEWDDYAFFAEKKRLAIVNTSRGCPHGCTFCSQQLFWERSWRPRNPEKVVEEIENLRNKYDIGVFMFSDELPTKDRERWERLLDLIIERDLGIDILMETRVDEVLRDKDIMDKHKKAGVTHIYVGVEAVKQETLDLFGKDIKVAQSKKAIEVIKEHDIIAETSLVLGTPDETVESIKVTRELAKHYNPDMCFFLYLAPWPYSEIYSSVKPYIVTDDYSKYNLVTPVIKPKAMTIEELEREVNRSYIEFYLGKMKEIPRMSSFKRRYMKEVFRALRENSCIRDLMKGLTPSKIPLLKVSDTPKGK
jgi:anaerobic magnesium-protoporphyrin IX monomethyl ester cyclase